MAPTFSPLDASSYRHPHRNGPYESLREATILAMLEQGIEYNTLSENPVSWADDQDPFGHVMAQSYMHYAGNSFIRLLESFEGHLKDEFPRFMSGRGIGAMSKQCSMKAKRVVKYPDLLITGVRILDVHMDRIRVDYYIWSVTQNVLVTEFQTWIVFFHHKEQRLVNLAEEGGVYQSLHASLTERAAESRRTLNAWEEKQAQKAGSNTAKL
ncbi:hypothetical protein N7519_011689 [Penicillium mononematosum]|uniref:uncharacterized protein n=1 Tax=Penicillium mononematosum TaxID=268346 RepID=UPI002549720F|nr:uncharacterized protein N7519_011689 [Penicillium mononematosum]KAJ6181228.1 hypothetical protein N7519_011689 [Penicillium mononematosum]